MSKVPTMESYPDVHDLTEYQEEKRAPKRDGQCCPQWVFPFQKPLNVSNALKIQNFQASRGTEDLKSQENRPKIHKVAKQFEREKTNLRNRSDQGNDP